MFFSLKLCICQDPRIAWARIPPKKTIFGHFSLVSLISPHPRSCRGAERIRQGEGRCSRPSKTALERSDLTEKFQFREPRTEAETKKNSWPIPVLSKTRITLYIANMMIGQTTEIGIPQPLRATVRYSRIRPGFLPRSATLIGQLSLVPVFDTNSMRYIVPWLFGSAVIAF